MLGSMLGLGALLVGDLLVGKCALLGDGVVGMEMERGLEGRIIWITRI